MYFQVGPVQGRPTWAGGPLEAAPAGVSPRAKAGALEGRPPWEAPYVGGLGILDAGKDRKTNAEITPLEVRESRGVSITEACLLDAQAKGTLACRL